MTRSSRGRGRRGAGFAGTAARASASWRTRAGARPTRTSCFSFQLRSRARVPHVVANLLSESLLFSSFYALLRSWSGQLAASVSESMQVPLPSNRRVLVSAVAVRSDVQGKAALRGPGQPPLEKSVPARDMPSEGCLFERRHPNSAGTAASGRKILAKQAKRFGQQTGRDQLIPGRLER